MISKHSENTKIDTLPSSDKGLRPHKGWVRAAVATLLFLTLIVVVIIFFDWNLLRGPIAQRVTALTGRSFAINGDLTVHLSLQPRIIANDIVLGNRAGSDEPNMAQIKRLDFRVNLLKLLAGHVVLPEIALSEPRVWLEINGDGEPNWIFNPKHKPIEFPEIGALTIDQGSATYRDLKHLTDLELAVKTLADGTEKSDFRLEVTGKGRFKGMPTSLQGRGGALLSVRDATHPYPLQVVAMMGTTKASIDGTLVDPLNLKSEQLNFKLEGSDLALLFPIIGVPIPPTPAYKLAGFLDHANHIWTFRRFKGVVGQSDISGDFAVDRSQQPQKITANLVSQKLLMRDLGGFIGADRGTRRSEAPPPSDRLMPTEPFSLEKIQAADMDVLFRGEHIVTESMPLEKMSAHLLVNSGVLKLKPLDFWMAGGHLVSQIEMDGSQKNITTRADIVAKGLRLDQMFPNSKLASANTGTMGGRAKLVGKGNSMAQLLGSANGEAALIMDGGSVGELSLRLANLDIANSLRLLLAGDKQTPIGCMVGNFKAVNGDFIVQDLVLDTPKVNVTGSGDINFIDESLHIRLVSRSKGFSLASLRGPVNIAGTFKNPAVRPELGNAIVRGGLAAALGAATAGIGALLPLLDFGKNNDSNCAALISQAKSDAGVKTSDMTSKAKKSTAAPAASNKSVKPTATGKSASSKESTSQPAP